MPDPAKSVDDIDDVLSSIRRLVAEQPGPKWQGHTSGTDNAMRPSADDRLVLTPALRVTDTEARAEDAAAQEVAAEADPTRIAPLSDHEVDATDALPAAVGEDASQSPAEEIAQEVAGSGLDAKATDAPAATADPEANADETAPALADDAPRPDMDERRDMSGPTDQTDPQADAQDVTEATVALGDASPANDTTAPEATADPLAPLEDEAPATQAEHAPDAPDAPTAPRVVGDDGWRPEMRLFDWDASADTSQDADDPLGDAPADFESETGDANWPDETADRAVLDLAAVREGEGAEPSGPTVTADAHPATAGFTPIFSRRNTDAGMHDVLRTDAPSEYAMRDAGDNSPEPGETTSGHGADHPPEQADPSTDLEPETDNASSAIWHTETDAFHLLDVPVEDDANAGDAESAKAGTPPETKDVQPVAFSSVRDTRNDADKTGVAGDSGAPSDPDMSDTAPVTREETTTRAAAATAPNGSEGALTDTADAGPRNEHAAQDADTTAKLDLDAIDEDVLRRIVAEAVREELQGALGERITRNVRKLVRREIRLVLAVDELD